MRNSIVLSKGIATGLALVSASACIPGRDNPMDPSVRPKAQLVVADWTPDGGDCESVLVTPSSGANSVSVAPIAHCLVLDARRSSDPNQGHGLEYRYFGGPLPENGFETDESHLKLGDARFDMALFESVVFEVRVTDDSGFDDTTAVSFTPTDVAPAVKASRGVSLPAGGYPWRPGAVFDVTLSATGADEDGDPLDFCWTLTGGIDLGCSRDPVVTQVTTSAHQIVATVEAFDGKLRSFPSALPVRVEALPLWTYVPGDLPPDIAPGPLQRIDVTRSSLPGSVMSPMTPVTEDGVILAAAGCGGCFVVFETFDRASGTPGVPLMMFNNQNAEPSYLVRFDAARSRAWLLGFELLTPQAQAGATMRTATIDIASGSLVATIDRDLTSAAAKESMTALEMASVLPSFPLGVIDSSGVAWLSRTGSHRVHAIEPVSGSPVFTATNGGLVTGLAFSPVANEVWASTSSPAALVRLDEGVREELPLPSASAVGIAFVDDARVWTWLPERGFVLLDVEALRRGDPFEERVLLAAVDPGVLLDERDGASFVTDPFTGTLHAVSTEDDVTIEVRPEGTESVRAGKAYAQQIYADGRVDFTIADTYWHGQIASESAAVTIDSGSQQTSFDWSTGELWAEHSPDNIAGRYFRMDPAGTLISSLGAFPDAGGNSVPLKTIRAAGGVSPEGDYMWTFAGKVGLNEQAATDIVSIALSTSGEAVSGIARAPGYYAVEGSFALAPFAPIDETSRSRAWVGGSIAPAGISIFDAGAGPAVTSVSTNLGSMDRSLRSNDLCFLAAVGGGAFELRRATAADPASHTFQSAVPVATGLILSAASDAEYDACWLSYENANRLFEARSAGGALVHSATIALPNVRDILSRSAHEVFAVDDAGTVFRIAFTPGVLGSPTVTTVATGSGTAFLHN